MFDSNEIAKKAFRYAQEMTLEKKRRKRWKIAVAIICAFVVAIAAVITLNSISTDAPVTHIEDSRVPLVESPLPEENARP